MNHENLGAYFREFRMARKIPLAAAAAGAKSTLSRFEKGGQLRTERMYATMARMGMWTDDICTHFEAFNAPFNQCAEKLIDHRFVLTSELVARYTAQYVQRVGEEDSQLHRLNLQVLAGLQQQAGGEEILLSASVQATIENLLTVPHIWMTYDYYLLRLSAAMLATTCLTRCVQAMQVQPEAIVSGMHQYLISVQEQAVLVCLCRHNRTLAQTLFNQINVQQADMFWIKDTYLLNLMKALLFDEAQLPIILDVLNVLALEDMARYCHQLVEIVKGQMQGVLL